MNIETDEISKVKTANTLKSNIIWELANRELGNFTQICKEIVFLKHEDNKPKITLELFGLFFVIMCLQGLPNWQLTVAGLARISRTSKPTISKYLNHLIELGYIERIEEHRNSMGQFIPLYIIHDTIDEAKWVKAEYLSKNIPSMEKPSTVKPKSEKYAQYNNKTIKEKNNIKIKELKTKEDISNATKQNKTKDITLTAISNVSNMDNINSQKKFNHKSGRKSKAEKSKEEILPKLDLVENEELKYELKQYIIMRIDKYGAIHPNTLEALMNRLHELSEDIEEQIQIVKSSREREWKGFFELNEKAKKELEAKKLKNKILAKTQTVPEIKEFKDANGNLITF